MTKLTRPLRREVSSLHHGPLIVLLTEEGLYLRQKGRRMKYLLPYGRAYQNAASLEADRQRAERKAKRKRKR
jgi:hypothetical protein